MPQTVVVWGESEDKSGVETGLAALASDQTCNTSGDKITIPDAYPYVAAILVGTQKATHIMIDARLAAPNIGGMGINNLRLHKAYAQTTKSPGNVYDFFDMPLALGTGDNNIAGDTLTAYSLDTDEAGTAHINSISLFVTNTRLPAQPHKITHIVKFTVAAIAAALTWEAKSLVLDDDLPVGQYKLWGADLCSATAIAARFIVPKVPYRPAFIPRRTQAEEPHPFNQCIHPGGVPFAYEGGALTIKLEYCAETTDTALSGALFLEYLGK